MKWLQKFASVHDSVQNHFNQERHLVDCKTYKLRRSAALAEWQSLRRRQNMRICGVAISLQRLDR
jgi:hypothetical protein